jgi:signal transduction histidine kinase
MILHLHSLTYILDRPAEAREKLESLLEMGSQAIVEGRDAVRAMRSSTVIKNDLASALVTVGEGLASEQTSRGPVGFRVVVEGESRDLHPIVRDEVYRIASEATRNAFRHSGANRIEIEICYDHRQLRVRVEDNGKGIDPKVLNGDGHGEHYGLPGMRERAKLTGGKLTVRSKLDLGTEIELTIPASLAYAKST